MIISASILLKKIIFGQNKIVEKLKTYFPKIVPLMRQCRKILYSRTDHR